MSELDKTLAKRGGRYGRFMGNGVITQGLKDVMRASPNWEKLSPDKKEALDMIAHKISRILNGDPEYGDSWHDIAGYAKLVEDELNEHQQPRTHDTLPDGSPAHPQAGREPVPRPFVLGRDAGHMYGPSLRPPIR